MRQIPVYENMTFKKENELQTELMNVKHSITTGVQKQGERVHEYALQAGIALQSKL